MARSWCTAFKATAYIDRETVEGLTNEQLARLEHHVTEVSLRVFAASVAGMVKGVRKYPSEPVRKDQAAYWRDTKEAGDVQEYWLPHIFSEAVDCANQTGLFRRRPGGGTNAHADRQLTLGS